VASHRFFPVPTPRLFLLPRPFFFLSLNGFWDDGVDRPYPPMPVLIFPLVYLATLNRLRGGELERVNPQPLVVVARSSLGPLFSFPLAVAILPPSRLAQKTAIKSGIPPLFFFLPHCAPFFPPFSFFPDQTRKMAPRFLFPSFYGP